MKKLTALLMSLCLVLPMVNLAFAEVEELWVVNAEIPQGKNGIEPTGSRNMESLTLPVFSTFDGDQVDSPPETGGPNEPTSLIIPQSGSILVRSAANGITTQPVEINDGGSAEYGSVDYIFTQVSTGILRIEATVAFDHLVSGYFLQTSVPSAVASRLGMTVDGCITNYGSTTIGTYIGDRIRCTYLLSNNA